MKRNSSIDMVRALACVAVLFIHCRLPEPVPQYMDALGRFAVPFFLMVSGYFTYRASRGEALAAACKHLRGTIRLTAIGTLLYAVSNTIGQLRTNKPAFSWLNSLTAPGGVLRFFIFNRAVFLSSVMYYLFMLVYVYVIFYLLLRCNAVRYAQKLIPLLLGACVVLTEFVGTPWYYSGNFLLTGLPFFLLGYYFAGKGKTYACAKYFILPGIVLTLAEAVYFHNDVYCYIGTLVLSISLFLACLHQPEARVPKALAWFGRNCSVYVFLIHCAVRDHVYPFFPQRPKINLWIRPMVVLGISVLLSIVYAVLRRKVRWLINNGRNVCTGK